MKNKILYLIASISIVCCFNSCSEKRLDIPPLDILTSDQVFSGAASLKSYLASLYNEIQVEDFPFTYTGQSTDEVIANNAFQSENIGNGTNHSWWGYNTVRNVNDFILKLPAARISELDKKTMMGEAKFIRAFYYFSMVKRYGGVPIITDVQSFTGNNLEQLQVARNKEQEVWDFVADDLDEAIELLPETNAMGRASKYAALALKSRAMLYAASIAKYGSIQLNGLLGIPSSEANRYWQSALDAANSVIVSGKYSLYQKQNDKILNFQQLFMDNKGTNPEAIFLKCYLYPDKTHNWDLWIVPLVLRGREGYSGNQCVTLQTVEQFEYKDGSPGTLKIGTPTSPIYYTKATDLFADMDPRLMASVVVPFSTLKGSIIDMQDGLYDLGVKVTAGDYSALYNPVTHSTVNGTMHIVGFNGTLGSEVSPTAFTLKKYIDENLPYGRVSANGSDQNWMVFRYAEVLLNYAEASVELGLIPQTTEKINLIRSRAGIATLTDADITIDRVRHERLVEFLGENQRFWDYRRWRIMHLLMNNWWPQKLQVYYDLQQNKYRFARSNTGKYPKNWDPKVYYEKIATTELTKNPNLVQNPDY